MPPSSQRRTRTRKQAEPTERSDADDFDNVATPTRKRKRATDHTGTPTKVETAPNSRNEPVNRRKKQRAGEIKVFEDESVTHDDIDDVFPNLRVARYAIQARIDHADEVHEATHPDGKQAFAKIAGNGWTYYVDELRVRIGRPPDEKQEGGNDPAKADAEEDKSLVHIDLGPSKLVSRQHAEIRYHDRDGRWYIDVNGRNGVKLDEEPLGRGMTGVVRCGSVIDIAGTQMMFVTPNEKPNVHPTIMAQLRPLNDDSREDDDDADQFHPPARPQQRTPARGPQSSRGGGHQRSSSSKDQKNYGNGQHSQHRRGTSGIAQHDGSGDSSEMRLPSSQLGVKQSPTYSRGLMLESTEDIDYGQDSAKDLKPPHSYAQLIGMAIMSNPEEKLTLSKIYDFIKEHYAFYRFSGGGWQNSIRHNLSLNKCFEKIARRTDEPGKGMKWQIVAEHRSEFLKKGISNVKKGSARGSSGPSSPVKERPSSSAMDKAFSDKHMNDPFGPDADSAKRESKFVKTSPRSASPSLGSYPRDDHTRTPERGSSFFNGLPETSPGNGIGMSPFPDRSRDNRHFTEAAAAGTPGGPSLFSGLDMNDRLFTPLISRQMPKLGPPSTAHLPSQFVAMSSPAPFWKYAAEFASSPVKGLNSSPVKDIKVNIAKEDEEDEKKFTKPAAVPSSSPAPAEGEVGKGSPTRTLSSRGRDLGQPQNRSRAQPSSQTNHSQHGQSQQNQPSFHNQKHNLAPSSLALHDGDDDDEEEGGMIDLAKGFQTIGAFHSNMNAHTAGAIKGN